MRKYLVGLLAAYAATTTLLAFHWSAEASVYRECFNLLMEGKHGHPVYYSNLLSIYNDFGLTNSPWAYWYFRVADSSMFLTSVIGGLFAMGLIFPKYLFRRRRADRDEVG